MWLLTHPATSSEKKPNLHVIASLYQPMYVHNFTFSSFIKFYSSQILNWDTILRNSSRIHSSSILRWSNKASGDQTQPSPRGFTENLLTPDCILSSHYFQRMIPFYIYSYIFQQMYDVILKCIRLYVTKLIHSVTTDKDTENWKCICIESYINWSKETLYCCSVQKIIYPTSTKINC